MFDFKTYLDELRLGAKTDLYCLIEEYRPELVEAANLNIEEWAAVISLARLAGITHEEIAGYCYIQPETVGAWLEGRLVPGTVLGDKVITYLFSRVAKNGGV